MTKQLLLAALILLPSTARAERPSPARVEALARDFLTQEKGVGLVIGIVSGKETTIHGFGLRAKDGAAVTADTEFEIGSISKTMTGLLLARAVLAGKARLDDDVRVYLTGDYPLLAFEGTPVTLLHLANMTSGLPDNLPDLSALDPDPGRFKHAAALAQYGKVQFLEDLRAIAPKTRPGAEVAHSNLAAQLLIYALERIYGEPYDILLKRELEKPLRFSPGPAASGYDAEGRKTAILPRAQFGYRYSMKSMLRYAALQLDKTDPAIALSHQGTWFTLDRKTWVGLGWIASELPEGGRQLRYSGGTWGFTSVMMVYPEKKVALVLMANTTSATAQQKLSAIATQLASSASPK